MRQNSSCRIALKMSLQNFLFYDKCLVYFQGLFECEDGSEQDVMIKTVLTGSSSHQSQVKKI